MGINLGSIKPDFKNMKMYKGISFVPIVSEEESEIEGIKFIWEGIEDKTIQIQELDSSSVPRVKVKNNSKTSYLGYKGTIIRGGGQNRQILHSVVIPEDADIEVPVQCIQKGRWNPHQQKNFHSKKGDVTSSSLRFKTKTQHDTWDTITHTTNLSGTLSFTQDYTQTFDFILGSEEEAKLAEKNMNSESKQKEKRQKARDESQNILKEMEKTVDKQVGIYVVMVDPIELKKKNEKKQSILEIFGSSKLYEKVHKDIISSFILDMTPLFSSKEKVENINLEQKDFDKLMDKLQKTNWKESGSIGKEKRKEISDKELYAETISIKEDIVHFMCSTI